MAGEMRKHMTLHSQLKRLVLVTALAALSGALLPIAAHATSGSAGQLVAGPARGIVYPRGYDPLNSAEGSAPYARRSANMTYHGGVIMPMAVSKAIFWGPSWPDATSTGDKLVGIDSFYQGFSGTNYAQISDEYTGSNGQVGPTSIYQGHIIDTSAAAGGASTSAILAEVAKLNHQSRSQRQWVLSRVHGRAARVAGYCAWHSTGTVQGIRVQFAFFWKLDGDAGCDPQDTTTGHSQGLAALANVSAHELSEARTDPANPGAWYDSSGQENGDKCAWTFNVPSVPFANGTMWKLQGEWSNQAYTAGTGYPNGAKQHGCLDGH